MSSWGRERERESRFKAAPGHGGVSSEPPASEAPPYLPPRPPLPASASVSPVGLPAAEPPRCAAWPCRSAARLPPRVSCRCQGQQRGTSGGMSGVPFLSCCRSEARPHPHPHLESLSLSNGFIPLLQDLFQGRLCPGVPQCSSRLGFWVLLEGNGWRR